MKVRCGSRCQVSATCLTPACCLTYSAAWFVQNSSAVMIWVITWPGRVITKEDALGDVISMLFKSYVMRMIMS